MLTVCVYSKGWCCINLPNYNSPNANMPKPNPNTNPNPKPNTNPNTKPTVLIYSTACYCRGPTKNLGIIFMNLCWSSCIFYAILCHFWSNFMLFYAIYHILVSFYAPNKSLWFFMILCRIGPLLLLMPNYVQIISRVFF